MSEFGEIWGRHGGGLQRVAASYVARGPEREDLEQEIAIAAHRAISRFRGECSVRTYLFRVAHNCCLKHVSRRPSLAEPLLETDHADTTPDPEAVLGARQSAERLATAMRSLPLGQRQVLALALEQLSLGEIAEVLDINENAAGVRLHRARGALRERLAAVGQAPKGQRHDR